MFLKLKIYEVVIKGRGCVDGRKQWNWLSKEDSTSPTVSTEVLTLPCVIEAMKICDVATADIPGDFL